MNRNEFIERLRDALQGEVPPSEIQSNVQYYQEYILEEMRKGRPESEVLEELGDPRLIARTIFDSREAAAGHYGERYTYNEEPESAGSCDRGTYTEPAATETTAPELWEKIKPTLVIAGIVVAGLAVLSVLFSVAVRILLSPVFWAVLVVWAFWRTLKR